MLFLPRQAKNEGSVLKLKSKPRGRDLIGYATFFLWNFARNSNKNWITILRNLISTFTVARPWSSWLPPPPTVATFRDPIYRELYIKISCIYIFPRPSPFCFYFYKKKKERTIKRKKWERKEREHLSLRWRRRREKCFSNVSREKR